MEKELLQKKIEKIHDYIHSNPEGHIPQLLTNFQILINFIQTLKNMANFDEFFDSKGREKSNKRFQKEENDQNK